MFATLSRYIIGPELLWLSIYIIARIFSKFNKAPNYAFDYIIENSWIWVPIFVFFTFGLFWMSGVEKNWLILRIWIAGIVIGHLVLENLLNAYSSQGPGIGMGYLAGILFVFLVLAIGTVIVKIVH